MHPLRAGRSLALLIATLMVAACSSSTPGSSSQVVGGSGGPSIVPVIASSEAVVGTSRILFGLLDSTGTSAVGAPDWQVQVGYIDTDKDPRALAIPATPATFVWAIPNQRAVWVQDATFDTAGTWAAVVSVTAPGKPAETSQLSLPVTATGKAIRVGAKAPITATPTAASANGVLASITTDPNPDPAFYQVSEDQAIAQHKPFVLVFATPAFCTSRVCGPTLDAVKAIARTEPTMVFIQVEPYIMNYENGTLQPVLAPGNPPSLQANAATTAWGIQSEPWVYVVDSTGTVTASYEAVIIPAELTAAIDKVKTGS
jgi:hypothetical protein